MRSGLSRPTADTASAVLGFALTGFAVFLAAEGPLRLGLLIYTEQIVSVILGLALAICFLTRPSRGWAGTLPLHDVLLATAGLGAGLYVAVRYPVLSQAFFFHPRETLAIGVVMIPLIIEGLRRTAGWGLVAVVVVFLLYALVADLVPGTLQGRSSSLGELLAFLAIDSTAIFGTPLLIVVAIVLMFILFGNLLVVTGGSEWFTDLSASLVGRTRGGAAKIAVVASAFFGSISGSAVANVASTGVITIPLMKRSGLSARLSGAFEAVASTGGQIMPPVMGAAAFLMAEFLQVAYSDVIIAALVPAVLFFLAVLIQADLEAAKLKIAPVATDAIKPLGSVLRAGWYLPLPFALLVVALFRWNMSPAQAALWSALAVVALHLVFGYSGRRSTPGQLLRAVATTGLASVEIVLVAAAAGIIIGIFENTGLSFGLTFLLVQFGRDSLLLLLVLTGLICILLGMGMPTTGIYLLVATLAAPPLIELGIDPMAAHLFILYFGLMSMISPPVAVAAFAAASIAGARPMATAMTAVRIGWPAFIIPFLFVYSPTLLLRGEPATIIAAVVTAIVGVYFLSAGFVGFMQRRLAWWMRGSAAAAGLCLIIPSNAFAGAVWLVVAGAVLAGFTFVAQRSQ